MVSAFVDAIIALLSPESPGDSVSFLRYRLQSINRLRSLGDLALEFCTCSWHTVMRFLAESISSFVGRTRESLPLNRLLPLLRPLFTVIGCAAMYTDLEPRPIYSLVGHAEASGHLHGAHIWYLLPIPIFAGCHERAVSRRRI